jgi:hypothetical protein
MSGRPRANSASTVCACELDLRDTDEPRLIGRVQQHAKEARDLDLNETARRQDGEAGPACCPEMERDDEDAGL